LSTPSPAMTAMGLSFLCVAALLHVSAADDMQTLMKDLQAIVEERASKYNCSFSIAVKSPTLGDTVKVASHDITTESRFAWGSITKMWTGASIMQLVAAGKLKLDEPFAPYVDAQFAAMKKINFPGMTFTKASDLWGPKVNEVTIRNLLHMQSGVPDFDTATPSRTGKPSDSFRATVYANPSKDFLEPMLMSVPWVATHNLTSTPGSGFHYSSTNFGLLGLILAHHAGIADYRTFNQTSFLPDELAASAAGIKWARTGSPRDNGVVDGFDRTDYNGQDPNKTGGVNVIDVHGVFSGWSASDFTGAPSVVAELGHALWGNGSTIVPKKYRDMMVPSASNNHGKEEFYGFASQNVGLMGITGGEGDFATAYGHLGATYGYDSIFGYNPRLDLGVSIASSIETMDQTQPADAYCGVFNRVKNFMLKEPVEICTYQTSGYYGGQCVCKPPKTALIV